MWRTVRLKAWRRCLVFLRGCRVVGLPVVGSVGLGEYSPFSFFVGNEEFEPGDARFGGCANYNGELVEKFGYLDSLG